MSKVFAIVIAALTTLPVWAQEAVVPDEPATEIATGLQPVDAAGLDLKQFIWTNRVLVIFADSPADPALQQQLRLFSADPEPLRLRDVVVVTDTDPANSSPARKQLRPRGFSLVWVDKDGEVRLRKASPWSVREVAQAIDKTPLRREEMLQGTALSQ